MLQFSFCLSLRLVEQLLLQVPPHQLQIVDAEPIDFMLGY